MDVGCGTGILSLFAAKAGASKVIAVDCADIIDHTERVVSDNNYSDVIHVIKGKIENVQLPCAKVDIIISEWMGYCLFFESMLESVIFARNKWLKHEGILFPDRCTLYLTAINDTGTKNELMNFWNDVYGFNMSIMKNVSLKDARIIAIDPDRVSFL